MDGGSLSPAQARPEELTGPTRRLVNEFQRDLPLTSRPFRAIAQRLGWSEAAVLEALAGLVAAGVVSRVGPVIRPNTIGVSALAAMAVPEQHLAAVAALVNARPEVNHNYQREHRFNLWFVLTASAQQALDAAVRGIEVESGLPVMVLPMLEDYYIDLGFDLDGRGKRRETAAGRPRRAGTADETDRRLLRAVQDGLPLTAEPYASVAAQCGMTEGEVRTRLGRLIEAGIVKRLGIVVRHHECGYRHNAMVVWDVPDHRVDATGRELALVDSVRLCYRRPRRPPHWPYNLFCMIHGRDREAVMAEVEGIAAQAGLKDHPRDVLFSVRRFKQRGARYGLDPAPAESKVQPA